MAVPFDTFEAARSRNLLHKKELADVVLVFSVKHPNTLKQTVRQHLERTAPQAEADDRESKRARTQHAPAAVSPMQWPEGCVVMDVHASQLYRCSELLHRQLDGSSDLYPPLYLPKQLPDGTLTRQRVLVVGLEGQEQLAAAEPLVQLMYQHDVISPMQDQPESLLHLLLLADQLQAEACVQACTAALAALQPSSLTLPFMSHLCCVADTQLGDNAPPLKDFVTACMNFLQQLTASTQPIPNQLTASVTALTDLPSSRFHKGLGMRVLPLLQRWPSSADAALPLVMRLLGKAEQVANDTAMLSAFKALPLPVLRHWVGSEQLCARSENTVLGLVDAWRQAQNPDASMRDLAACIRLRHLSPAFLHRVLDSLTWFTPKENLADVRALIEHTPRDGEATYPHGVDLPAAWLDPQPRPSTSEDQPAAGQQGVALTLNVTLDQLQAHFSELLAANAATKRFKSILGNHMTINGFRMHLFLRLLKAAGSTSVVVGLFLMCNGVMSEPRTKPWVHIKFQFFSQPASTRRVSCFKNLSSQRTFSTQADNWGSQNFFGLGPISTTDPLQPFLVDGQLKLRPVITQIDGVALAQ